jgi:hypothetical protein
MQFSPNLPWNGSPAPTAAVLALTDSGTNQFGTCDSAIDTKGLDYIKLLDNVDPNAMTATIPASVASAVPSTFAAGQMIQLALMSPDFSTVYAITTPLTVTGGTDAYVLVLELCIHRLALAHDYEQQFGFCVLGFSYANCFR